MVFDVNIHFDLETNPLEIKTESVAGSDDILYLTFFGGGTAGGLNIFFKSMKYEVFHCTGEEEFPDNLPTETDKTWRITLSRTSGNKRVVVHCNGVEVVDVVISGTTCSKSSNYVWDYDVAEIKFGGRGTAPKQYRGNFQEK